MATQQPTAQQMQQMMTETMDQSIALTAKLFGLPEEMVRRIVQIGLPIMAKMAADTASLRPALRSPWRRWPVLACILQ